MPDGALDSILSVLCSSLIEDSLIYSVYQIGGMEEDASVWQDVRNFRLVAKSFQRVTDRVVPSFALYQQLFNKGVNETAWITKEEDALTRNYKGFVSDAAHFQEKGCDPLLLPDLSSMPLFKLELIVNVKIHELLISNAVLKSEISIVYAFPNNNTLGFILTLPSSSLHPGKQLAFQVTSLSGYTEQDSYINDRVILVQVNDISLAQMLGIVPSKANLVLNEATSSSSGETSGERFAK